MAELKVDKFTLGVCETNFYYVYEEDYTMFALSPLVGWVFFVVGIIWTIGFLKAILKTIRIQTQMNPR